MRQNALGGRIDPSDRNQVQAAERLACAVALSVAIPWSKASGEAANTTPSKTPPSLHRGRALGRRPGARIRAYRQRVLGSVHGAAQTASRHVAPRQSGSGMRGAAGLHARGRVPGKADPEGSAWEETYAISCKKRVRRTFLLFLSVKEGMKHSELAPGDTIADAILQRDFLQSARPRP